MVTFGWTPSASGDLNQCRPDAARCDELWSKAELLQIEDTPPGVTRYLQEAGRLLLNGGAQCAQFDVLSSEDLSWFGASTRAEPQGDVHRVLSHTTVQAALPELLEGYRPEVKFDLGSPLTLDGELASVLLFGGPYARFKGTPAEAKRMGNEVCQALFEERFGDVAVFISVEAWSYWFNGIAWDFSCILFDRRRMRVSVLCTTDTD